MRWMDHVGKIRGGDTANIRGHVTRRQCVAWTSGESGALDGTHFDRSAGVGGGGM